MSSPSIAQRKAALAGAIRDRQVQAKPSRAASANMPPDSSLFQTRNRHMRSDQEIEIAERFCLVLLT
jgi:hypothetical protein